MQKLSRFKSIPFNKLKIRIIFFFIFALNYLITAQPVIEWEKSYGGLDHDRAYSMQQTTDGGYIIAGQSESNDGDVGGNNGRIDFWVVKIDGLGNLEWEKNYGGVGTDKASSIQETTDGGYIIAGSSSNTAADYPHFWIVKVDELGNVEWDKRYEYTEGISSAYSIKQTKDGGYIVGGKSHLQIWECYWDYYSYFYNCGYADQPANSWILKLDDLGNVEWEKEYGGSHYEWAASIQQTADDGYIIANNSHSSDGDFDGNNGLIDIWIVKMDEIGNIIWEKNYGGSENDEVSSIIQTADRGYALVGSSSSNDGDIGGNNGRSDYLIIKLDEWGNLQWQKNYGGPGRDGATSIQQTSDGGYIVGGSGEIGTLFDDDYWVLKLDQYGNLEWEENFGGSHYDWATSILQATDDSYVVAGYTFSDDRDVSGNFGYYDFWIVKFSATGISDFCPLNWAIDENTLFQNLYQSSAEITTNGSVFIDFDQEVEYNAEKVRINEGFSVKAGAHFKVRIDGCD